MHSTSFAYRRHFVKCSLGFGLLGWASGRVAWGVDELNSETKMDLDWQSLSGSSKGPWRRLFLDGAVIEEQMGLRKVFHSAQKFEGNPILKADRPWEGKAAITGPYVYGSILREGNLLRMWYQVLHEGNHVGYAESQDGIQWTKVVQNVISYEGQATNFVVSDLDANRTGGHCHNPSVIDRGTQVDPRRRYVLYGYDGSVSQPRVAYSADGLHWRYAESKGLFSSSDVVNFGWDPYAQRYYCTWKTRNRRGRAVGLALSQDGESWHKLYDGPIFVADDLDPDDTQIYGMPVFAYQGMYIGLPWMYRARYFRHGEYSIPKLHEAQADSSRKMEVQLAWSWDMVNWTRPKQRDEFLPLGPKDAWDDGMIVTAKAPIVMGDQLYFYYGGADEVHDDKRAQAGIGLAKLRLDGFCSMETEKEGWLRTRREVMRSPSIWINAKTAPGGSVVAELLDRKNRVIEGFSKEDCHAFEGDAVRHTLTWTKKELPKKAMESDVKIRFWLRNAQLYSYLPTDLDPKEPDLARFPEAGP
ncbi:MAG: hypothetical protein U0905_08645 [Pirellulales bacterium]